MQRTERIDESVGKELCHLLSFFVGESGVLAVGLGILQVYFLVCYVQVAAQDDWLLGIKLLDVVEEIVLPLHAVVESAQSVLRVGS